MKNVIKELQEKIDYFTSSARENEEVGKRYMELSIEEFKVAVATLEEVQEIRKAIKILEAHS